MQEYRSSDFVIRLRKKKHSEAYYDLHRFVVTFVKYSECMLKLGSKTVEIQVGKGMSGYMLKATPAW